MSGSGLILHQCYLQSFPSDFRVKLWVGLDLGVGLNFQMGMLFQQRILREEYTFIQLNSDVVAFYHLSKNCI